MRTRTMFTILFAGCVLCSWAVDKKGNKEQRARVSYDCIMSKLKNDAQVNPESFSDGFIPVYSDVPEQYSGWKITTLRYKNKGKSLEIRVKKAGIVTLSTPSKAFSALSADGWKEVGRYTVKKGGVKKSQFIIVEKYLEKGEYEFKAGGNKNSERPPCLLVGR